MILLEKWKQSINLRDVIPIAVIVIAFVILGVRYSLAVPIWEAPDETGHFGNVWYIATHKELPKPGTFYTWHQSPLYHLLAAAVISGVEMSPLEYWSRPNPNSPTVNFPGDPNIRLHSVRELPPLQDVPLAVHLARWVNVVFGAITIIATYIVARRLFPEHRWIAIGAMGLIAFNPQFIFMSAAVQNDAPLAAAFALALLPAVSIVQGDYRLRQFIWLGILTGLAILFKQSGIVVIGVAGAVVLWAVWASKRWGKLLPWAGLTGLALLLTAGPMYLRNTLLYGDPFAYQVYKSLHPPVNPMALGDITIAWLFDFADRMHRSFWGTFGWMSIPLPDQFYGPLWYIYPLALLGLALWLWRGRTTWGQPRGGLVSVILLLLAMAAVWSFVLRYVMLFGAFGKQGRYLFQLISAQSVLLSLGLYALFPQRLRPLPVAAIIAGLFALAVWIPDNIIKPAYTYLGDWPIVLQTAHAPRSDIFGESIELAGYTSTLNAQTRQLEATLFWITHNTPPADFTVFVHLLDAQGNRHSQHDRRPLDGAFPTHLWRPGDVLHTTHTLTYPAICQQSTCQLAVGFYKAETFERFPVTQGNGSNNAILLIAVTTTSVLR